LAEAAAIRAIAFGWSVLNPDHCGFVLGVTEVPPSKAAQKFSSLDAIPNRADSINRM
jgi:hypothetical protein